jgi:hypothetical protein
LLEEFADSSVLTWSYAAKEEPKKESDELLGELDELFSGHFCTFTVTLPHKITVTNGTAILSDDGHTAKWKFPMVSFMKGDTLRMNTTFHK